MSLSWVELTSALCSLQVICNCKVCKLLEIIKLFVFTPSYLLTEMQTYYDVAITRVVVWREFKGKDLLIPV